MRIHIPLPTAFKVFGSAVLLLLSPCSRAADQGEEARCIAVIQSGASSLQERDAACARLKIIGSKGAVAPLAALLADEQLSHSARYVLEAMNAPEANQALIEALEKTSGLSRVGIIDSLAVRHEAASVAPLLKLLASDDPQAARAAAHALGCIGGTKAARGLEEVFNKLTTVELREAVADALLVCGTSFARSGQSGAGHALFDRVYKANLPERFRVAAFAGLVRSSAPEEALKLVLGALAGKDPVLLPPALQCTRELKGVAATKALCDVLPRSEPSVQPALISALAQRGDVSAAQPLAKLLSSGDPEVRLASLKALALIGNDQVVEALVSCAASSSGQEQKTARESLGGLRDPKANSRMLELLGSGRPELQVEIAAALGARGDSQATPKLLDLARTGPEGTAAGALKALAVLAQPSDWKSLAEIVSGKPQPIAAKAAEALFLAVQRKPQQGGSDIKPVLEGFRGAAAPARALLLPVIGSVESPETRSAVRECVVSGDPAVRESGIRVLADTKDPELLPDLLKAAASVPEEKYRSICVAGSVRLLTQEEKCNLSNSQRVQAMKGLLVANTKPEHKKLVLAGLAQVPDAEALSVVDSMLQDSGAEAEAALAAMSLAPLLGGDHTDAALATLHKVIALRKDAGTQEKAKTLCRQIEARADFLTAWQVAGPFKQDGKNFAALFDVPFPPETANSNGVKWKALGASQEPNRVGVVDLLKEFGGEQCVGYARCWVYVPASSPAQLDMGSDDGIKVWLGDKVVYATNVARPLQPGSDKAQVSLQGGWNRLMLKVTQNNLGWEFCVRCSKPDGSRIAGMRFRASPPE